MYNNGAMLLRNRLATLLIRIAILTLYIVGFSGYVVEYPSFWTAISTWDVQLGTAMMVMLALEIIYTLIDLRHGIHGAAAGPHMRIALPLTVFAFLSGVFYFASLLPAGDAPDNGSAIFFHVMIMVGPMIDWLALDEKGTVKYSDAFFAQIYPILFLLYGYFRTLIWPGSPIYGQQMYPLPFLAFGQPESAGYIIAFFACTLGGCVVAVFLNKLAAGHFGFLRQRWD